MNLTLTPEEQKLIAELYTEYRRAADLDAFLQEFQRKTGLLLKSKYQGFLLFPSILTSDAKTISNNPPEFDRAYINRLMSMDIVLDDLMENPTDLQCLNSHDIRDRRIQSFLRESNSIRPSGDYGYAPVRYREELIGFLGHTLPEGEKHIFGEREALILRMVMPALNAGILSYTADEKIRLMDQIRREEDRSAWFYLWPDGSLEIPENSNRGLAEEVLQLRYVTSETILNHPLIRSVVRELHLKRPDTGTVTSLTVDRKGKSYVIRAIRRTGRRRHGYDLLAMITIEEAKTAYDYNRFRSRFSLTGREMEITRAIVRGQSNRDISETFCISLSTVKKHIANIFEKTGSRSRTQLILSLTRPD